MLGVGDSCPEVQGLEYVKGKQLVINGKQREMALVVEFWATWCPPCLQSIPHLTELQHRFRSSIEFVGITNEKSSKVSPFVDSMGAKMDYSVALDSTGAASRALMAAAGVQGIPHAFVVGRDGKILYSGHPMDGGFEEALQKASVERVQKEVRPLNYTREELVGMSVKELKTIILDHGKSIVGLLEKREFVDKILELGQAS